MIYLLIILFAFWNGYMIRWQQNKFETRRKDCLIWHRIGVFNRVGLWVIGIFIGTSFLWKNWIINPIVPIFDGLWAIAITTLLCLGMSYWLYNLIINKVNRWDWNYQKELTTQVYYLSLILYSISLIVLIVLGTVYGLKI